MLQNFKNTPDSMRFVLYNFYWRLFVCNELWYDESMYFWKVKALSKNGEKFPVEVNVSSFVVDEEVYYAAILRDMSQPVKMSTSSVAGRQATDKELRIKKKVITKLSYLCRACICVGIACWGNHEVYSQVKKPRIYHKSEYSMLCVYVYVCACLCVHMCVYVCIYILNNLFLSQEELHKVMSDSMNTASIEVRAYIHT